MAFFRGMDGSLNIVTNSQGVVLQLEGWSLTTQVEELDTTSMGDAWKSEVGGVASWSGQATVKLDLTASSSQQFLSSLLTGSTPTLQIINVQLRLSATKYFSGSILVKQMQSQMQLGQIAKATFDFTGSGPLTISWT